MGRRIINLKYEAICKDCGSPLPVGAPARYYGSGKIYGTECHEDTRKKSRGPIRSNYDPHAQAEG